MCSAAIEAANKAAAELAKTAGEAGTTGLELEVQLSPWNVTQNFLDMEAGLCQLKIVGNGDPTGASLGYAFLRAPNKPIQESRDPDKVVAKAPLANSDGDLRYKKSDQ